MMADQFNDKQHDDVGADWNAVAGLVRSAASDPVTDFDVRRLQRSVRAQLRAAHPFRTHLAARAAAVLAVVVIGGASLHALLEPPRYAPQASVSAPVSVSVAQDGAVVFSFEDASRTYRIVKDDAPVPTPDAQVGIARGGRFVDRESNPRPGEVVFYRID